VGGPLAVPPTWPAGGPAETVTPPAGAGLRSKRPRPDIRPRPDLRPPHTAVPQHRPDPYHPC